MPEYRKISPEDLKKILGQHRLWLESTGEKGQRADLRGADLSQADLSRADLRRADLSEANLFSANLFSADLRGADLSQADLSRADLSEANLFTANLRGADLRGADLSGAYLSQANLRGAYLRGADLSEAYLRGADLRGAQIEDADLREANIDGAKLMGLDMSRAITSDDDPRLKIQKPKPVDEGEPQPLASGAGLPGAEGPEDGSSGQDDDDEDDQGNGGGGESPGNDCRKLAQELSGTSRIARNIDIIDKTSALARKIFTPLLLSSAILVLTAYLTEPYNIVFNNSKFPLPLIKVAIPATGFFMTAPVFILGLSVWLNLYLLRLWPKLNELPEKEGDVTYWRQIDPWLILSLVPLISRYMKGASSLSDNLAGMGAALLVWGAAPSVAVVGWWACLPKQDWGTTAHGLGIIALATLTNLMFIQKTRSELEAASWEKAKKEDQLKTKIWVNCKRIYLPVALFLLGLATPLLYTFVSFDTPYQLDLCGKNLSKYESLTCSQLESAKIDFGTIVPDRLQACRDRILLGSGFEPKVD